MKTRTIMIASVVIIIVGWCIARATTLSKEEVAYRIIRTAATPIAPPPIPLKSTLYEEGTEGGIFLDGDPPYLGGTNGGGTNTIIELPRPKLIIEPILIPIETDTNTGAILVHGTPIPSGRKISSPGGVDRGWNNWRYAEAQYGDYIIVQWVDLATNLQYPEAAFRLTEIQTNSDGEWYTNICYPVRKAGANTMFIALPAGPCMPLQLYGQQSEPGLNLMITNYCIIGTNVFWIMDPDVGPIPCYTNYVLVVNGTNVTGTPVPPTPTNPMPIEISGPTNLDGITDMSDAYDKIDFQFKVDDSLIEYWINPDKNPRMIHLPKKNGLGEEEEDVYVHDFGIFTPPGWNLCEHIAYKTDLSDPEWSYLPGTSNMWANQFGFAWRPEIPVPYPNGFFKIYRKYIPPMSVYTTNVNYVGDWVAP